jgi:N-acylneuraminate cytidylyltransferase
VLKKQNIAFIPVRGGSKSIPLKNIKLLCGHPLVYWTVKAANDAESINKVVVATDSEEIKSTVESFNLPKVEVYERLAENAQDTSSTESVMLEYINQSDLSSEDRMFLIQATSPTLKSKHIDEMFKKFLDENSDSAFTGVISKRFYWGYYKDGHLSSVNYDYRNRPRRQDFDGYILENGACYINSILNILKYKNRLSGKISAYIMPEYSAYEIDEPDDFLIIEKLLEQHKD